MYVCMYIHNVCVRVCVCACVRVCVAVLGSDASGNSSERLKRDLLISGKRPTNIGKETY